jgi:hypothetical protein
VRVAGDGACGDGEPLPLNEFKLQVFERRIIQLELPLQRAVGQTTPLPKENDCLIQDRDKVHPVPSLSGALLGCVYVTPS